ncbi:hypothetical protein K469DRAFT_750395 [Zopfia rhizophila CBS 207.26]|uniref:Uncharacterized protein n=1 Tax=Zopfia rhizophila CBS 207.26 TaxID=1314779 RepID=A0A6A6E4V1_9PEZI|nr:hypothetical protein K469DRAFT_750395 [Zopfia rhizophila CBS 207.26]
MPSPRPSSPSVSLLSQSHVSRVSDTHDPDIELEHEPSTVPGAVLRPTEDQINDNAENYRSSSPLPPPPPSPNLWKRLRKWGWLWECLCWVLVIGALATMVTVLATAQNQPMTAWRDRHFNVSINAIVAVLSALLKGTSMFIVAEAIGQTKWRWFEKGRMLRDFERIDSASRGPWGSAKMLSWIRGPKLALFGAFISVVALAVDPFTQNIIATRSCQTLSTNQIALIPTADAYNTIAGIQIGMEPGQFTLWGKFRYGLDAAMKASVYSGLYGSATTVINASTIHAYCPGINCTFPRYTTLGVCHKCADISSSIKTICDRSLPSAEENISHPPCNWSLPTGQLLQSYADDNTYYKLMNNILADFSMDFITANSTLSTLILPNVPGTFTNVTILANATSNPNCTIDDDCDDSVGVVTMDFRTIAAECSLFPCARTYTASVVNGSVVEAEVKRSFAESDWADRTSEASYPVDVEINPHENCTGRDRGPCTYSAGTQFVMAAGNFFWHFWNGTIDRVLGGISDSMTAAIRLTGRVLDYNSGYGGGQGPVTGQVLLADTCISVRWGWIALPAAVTLLSLLLLILTLVLGGATGDQLAWKSSSLPVLFHGLSTAGLASKGELLTATEMEKEANGLRVKLTDKRNGTLRLEPWQSVDDDP